MEGSGDRLPWLTDEPAPETSPKAAAAPVHAAKPAPDRAMWPWYLLLLLLIGLVAGGAWWLGTRQRDVPPPQLPTEQPIGVPLPSAPLPSANAVEAEGREDPSASEPTAAPSPAAQARPVPATPSRGEGRPAERRAAPAAGEEDAGEQAAQRRVFPADEPAATPIPVTGPRPVVVYHPQRDRGRVIQLGAFPTRAQAEQAWRQVVRRYPYLATKPKMVNTVDVGALGGRRRTRMYRLQLGTSSQAQSVVICQQLERAGQSCVVVY